MKLTEKQEKIISVTAQLTLKTQEYASLCKKLEIVKQNNVDNDDPILIPLKDMFLKNSQEIAQLKEQLKQLK